MPKKRTFICLTIALAIISILCLILWLIPEKEEAVEETPIQTVFDENALDLITALSFTCNDNPSLSFTRSEIGWLADGRSNLPIDESRIRSLLGKLEHMLSLRTITEACGNIAEYGLDSPYCTISLTADGKVKTYLFGDHNDYYGGYYCMIDGSSAVYMVDETYVKQFDLTLEDLLGSDYLPDLGRLQSVVWQNADGSSFTATPEGANGELLSLLSSLELGKFIDYGSEQYPLFGLDSPATAKLTLWDGALLTLTFGLGETEEYIYLRVGESEMIYLAACDDLSALAAYVGGNAS